MTKPTLTIIVPVYDEEATIHELLTRCLQLPDKPQIIVVDNGSTDRTHDIAAEFCASGKIELLKHTAQQGKGAAIRAGLTLARGEYVVIQDGDLEYDTGDITKLHQLAIDENADAVFGSRNLNPQAGISYQRYYWGGRFLTWLANRLFNVGITDEATCYKLVRRSLLNEMNLECVRFEFCPEVVAKLGLMGVKIHERPISYQPRSIEEGKKIRWQDGVEAILTLIKWSLRPANFQSTAE